MCLELGQFRRRSSTDILGQHIHLVKFDVTSSDGAANGFNYEDGTFAPDEAIERINAFNNGSFTSASGQVHRLTPKFIKYFGADANCAAGGTRPQCDCKVVQQGGHYSVRGGRWCGSQATFQKWYVDPQLTNMGEDKTMRTVFTHDHFSPSIHQQTGLYAGLVAEPAGSIWLDNESGARLGNRVAPQQNGQAMKDGGPTSWQAVIQTVNQQDSYREFLLEFHDTTLMYRPFNASVKAPGYPSGTACGFCSTNHSQICVTNADSALYYGKVCKPIALPVTANGAQLVENKNPVTVVLEPSCNFIAGIPSQNSLFNTESKHNNIWANDDPKNPIQSIGWDSWPIEPGPQGLFVIGKQNTPAQPELLSFNGGTSNFSMNYRNDPLYPRVNAGGSTNANNASFAYASVARNLPGQQTPAYSPLTAGVEPNDPYTPILRAYANDDVQIRVLVGAHQNPHNFTVHGANWLFEPSNMNSGWRNTQTMGISEHYEYLFKVPAIAQPNAAAKSKPWTDHLYKTTAARQGQASGNWGLMRAYEKPQPSLHPLPQNPTPAAAVSVCPADLLGGSSGNYLPGWIIGECAQRRWSPIALLFGGGRLNSRVVSA